MALPSETEVATHVSNTVAAFAKFPSAKIQATMELAKKPLRLDDNQLTFLATAMRAYVKAHRESATVTVKDTKKSKQTVGGLSKTVHERIKGK